MLAGALVVLMRALQLEKEIEINKDRARKLLKKKNKAEHSPRSHPAPHSSTGLALPRCGCGALALVTRTQLCLRASAMSRMRGIPSFDAAHH